MPTQTTGPEGWLPVPGEQQAMAQTLARWLQQVQNKTRFAPAHTHADEPPTAAQAIWRCLSDRQFTHLSRTQAERYRESVCAALLPDCIAQRPIALNLDLGPGYHASVRADFSGLCFEPGLGELLALRQVRLFDQALRQVYAPGCRFTWLIDDLCAWVVNEVPLALTAGYQARLQQLIDAVGLGAQVRVLAESQVCSAQDYRDAFEATPPLVDASGLPPALSLAEVDNVSRFVGRACSLQEAQERVARYARALPLSARLMQPVLRGVRLTQRASADCLGFRPFSGGDVRIQSGQVHLLLMPSAPPRPKLLTHVQAHRYVQGAIAPHLLPAGWPLPPHAVQWLRPR